MLAADPRALTVRGGRLWPIDPGARRLLFDSIATAEGGDAALGTGAQSIHFAGPEGFDGAGSPALVGSVVSLADGSRREIGASCRAVAALSVRELRFDARPDASLLSQACRLTRRELTVLAGIAEFGTVPQAASVLGPSSATVRCHLKSIFQKTGTRRQAELVKLVAASGSPFRPAR